MKSNNNEIIKPLTEGKPRSNEDIIEALEAIKKELVSLKNFDPILVYYPTIIEALNELLERRNKDARKTTGTRTNKSI